MQVYGIVLVALAAISYGIPASLMKIAEIHGADLYNTLFFMFAFSFFILATMSYLKNKKTKNSIGFKGAVFLGISGTTIALTNVFYFRSLNYQPVAVSAVLLMQSVWIAVLTDCVLAKKMPDMTQSVCILLILMGTLAATGGFSNLHELSLQGFLYGIAAAFFYALTMRSTGHLFTNIDPVKKSSIMSLGAFLLFTSLCWKNLSTLNHMEDAGWGLALSLFSLVIPILLFSLGMPKIGGSLGGVLSSLELPSAVFFSWIFLGEKIHFINTLGILLIVTSVGVMSWLSNKVNGNGK